MTSKLTLNDIPTLLNKISMGLARLEESIDLANSDIINVLETSDSIIDIQTMIELVRKHVKELESLNLREGAYDSLVQILAYNLGKHCAEIEEPWNSYIENEISDYLDTPWDNLPNHHKMCIKAYFNRGYDFHKIDAFANDVVKMVTWDWEAKDWEGKSSYHMVSKTREFIKNNSELLDKPKLVASMLEKELVDD